MKAGKLIVLVLLILVSIHGVSQVSPGELCSYHSHLEGLSNCTQCHTLGDQVSNDKCLACHTEVKERIVANKGYHSSSEVKGKQCAACHSDHHGKNFQIVRFDANKFNHSTTGFVLSGAHSKKACADCHKPKFIATTKLKTKKFTYLGLKPNCVNCHTDVHQGTLSLNCGNCHDGNAFKPATKFRHTAAKYQLSGKHLTVECIKCHKIESRGEVKFQRFTGLQYSSCSNCHTDPHQNKFGPNCMECHSNESFTISKPLKGFDHSKTKYALEGKHLTVDCKTCHKLSYTTPIKHQKCSDCHKDYHKSQFTKEGVTPDCIVCHDLTGFTRSSFTIERHNQSTFALQGAHLAVPCIECHRKTPEWSFKDVGKRCIDCHKNIHAELISKKYMPDDNCLACHNVNAWTGVIFDHTQTNFKLQGAHTLQSCRKCHFNQNIDGTLTQRFAGLPANCASCHKDKHSGQFEKAGITDCSRCHQSDNWKASKFNHSSTAFKLDGKHLNVECKRCHKPTPSENNSYIRYKIPVKCESCHS